MTKIFAEALDSVGMSSRPSYYSGRGATLTDLNEQILTKIYEFICGRVGVDAGESFVDMVESMPEMNATDFIQNGYRLENNNWVWDFDPPVVGIDIEKDEKGKHNPMSMFGTMMAQQMNKRDDTWLIKGNFLLKMGRELPHHIRYGYLPW